MNGLLILNLRVTQNATWPCYVGRYLVVRLATRLKPLRMLSEPCAPIAMPQGQLTQFVVTAFGGGVLRLLHLGSSLQLPNAFLQSLDS
ncbi:MAG: hypothetical protein DPW14_16995 [Planctomycetes bacterium]|nr:hypothetical protein [Planctomycetota bacterium]